MNPTEAKALWLYMGEIWPNYRLPATDVELGTREKVWSDMLGDIPGATARAVIASMGDREFAPSPGQIREAADRMMMSAAGTEPPDPDEAWAEVRQAVRNPHQRDSPTWTHTAVSEAVEALGWRQFRMSEESAEGTWRAHFMKFYDSAARRWRQNRGIGLPPVTMAAARELRAGAREELGA